MFPSLSNPVGTVACVCSDGNDGQAEFLLEHREHSANAVLLPASGSADLWNSHSFRHPEHRNHLRLFAVLAGSGLSGSRGFCTRAAISAHVSAIGADSGRGCLSASYPSAATKPVATERCDQGALKQAVQHLLRTAINVWREPVNLPICVIDCVSQDSVLRWVRFCSLFELLCSWNGHAHLRGTGGRGSREAGWRSARYRRRVPS